MNMARYDKRWFTICAYHLLTLQTGIPDISSISVAPSCNQPKLMFETPKIGKYDGPKNLYNVPSMFVDPYISGFMMFEVEAIPNNRGFCSVSRQPPTRAVILCSCIRTHSSLVWAQTNMLELNCSKPPLILGSIHVVARIHFVRIITSSVLVTS
jgi:hypothetical protein